MMMTNIGHPGESAESMRQALDAYEIEHGSMAAFEHAFSLLNHELTVLEWRPEIGVALARWATPRPDVPAVLLHAMTSYLGLYYPELDEAVSSIQSLLATGKRDEAHRLLAASLDALAP